MPPKMDRAEATFDAIQGALDDRDISSWRPAEMEVLLSLLETYYTELKTQKILARRHGGSKPAKSDEGKEEDDAEEDDDGYDEDEDLAAREREAAVAEVDRALCKLRSFLQRKVPYGAVAEPATLPYSTATTTTPNAVESVNGEAKRARKEKGSPTPVQPVTYSIDSFLYLEDDIEQLTESGLISRHYCTGCGSTELAATDFITHSFSQDQLVFLSCFLLPALAEEGPELSARKIVDVGSRLGVVLWACAFAAQHGIIRRTEKLTGVELDARFAAVQLETGKRFCPQPIPLKLVDDDDDEEEDENPSSSKKAKKNKKSKAAPEQKHLTWSVVQSDCFAGAGAAALAEAGVLILHNVFEYFCATEVEHMSCWVKLRSLVKRPGQVLVCCPSIEETLMGFSEETLEACGVLAKEEEDKASGKKRARAADGRSNSNTKPNKKRQQAEKDKESSEDENSEDEDEFPPPGRKELAVARWIAEYLEAIDDEVEELVEDFITFRSAVQQPKEGVDEEGEEEGGCGDASCQDEACGHDHVHDGEGCCGGSEKEPTELEEQIRNIWVYKVK